MEELKKQLELKLEVLKKETENSNKIIFDILTAVFPQVIRLSLYSRTVKIITAKTNSQFGHEITIFNNYDCCVHEFQFKPQLSWFSSNANQNDTDMLNYLEVLGFVAKEMKNENSFLFNVIKGNLSHLYTLEGEVNKLRFDIDKIESDIKKKQEADKKMDFDANFKQGNFYVKQVYKSIYRDYSVKYIKKINPKNIIICDDGSTILGDNTINYLKRGYHSNNYDKRWLYDDLKSYELISEEELQKLISVTTIFNEKLSKITINVTNDFDFVSNETGVQKDYLIGNDEMNIKPSVCAILIYIGENDTICDDNTLVDFSRFGGVKCLQEGVYTYQGENKIEDVIYSIRRLGYKIKD